MRMFLFVLLGTLVLFPVGGGGGTSGAGSSSLDYTLRTDFTCPGNVLQVEAGVSGNPIEGMQISIQRDGQSIANAETDNRGVVRVTVTRGGSYYILATRSGYKTKDITTSIQLCETEGQSSAVQCDQATHRGRVQCILGLSEGQRTAVQGYIPEDCRTQDASAQNACVGTYRLFQRCRSFETDAGREACILPLLGIQGSVRETRAACENEGGTRKMLCIQQTKEKAFALVKFRMYNLEYKAEELLGLGASEEDVVQAIMRVDEAKIAFANARDMEERIVAVQALKQDWEMFIERVKQQWGIS